MRADSGLKGCAPPKNQAHRGGSLHRRALDGPATSALPARPPPAVRRPAPGWCLAHGGQVKADLTLSRKERGGFSAGYSGLSLLNRGEHAFTEIQAFPLHHAPIVGISKLAYLNGELV